MIKLKSLFCMLTSCVLAFSASAGFSYNTYSANIENDDIITGILIDENSDIIDITSDEEINQNSVETTTVTIESLTETTTTTVEFSNTKVLTQTAQVNNQTDITLDIFNIYDEHIDKVYGTTTTTTTKFALDGIDVSKYQGDVDWSKVKEDGIDFAIIRAGYGQINTQVDAKFHQNMANADAAGMDCGVYWYSYATTPEEAILEAEACYDVIKGYNLEYPLVFDIEEDRQRDLSTATVSAIVEAFCSTMEDKGYYVSIYSYASFLNTKIYEATLDKYDVWVAHFGVSSPSYNGDYGMWQYSDTGRVGGIDGDVDLDYAYKNYPYIMKTYGLNGY